MEDHINVVLQPLGVGIDYVLLEGRGQEVAGSPVGRELLLLLVWGGTDVNYVLPCHFGAGFLGLSFFSEAVAAIFAILEGSLFLLSSS